MIRRRVIAVTAAVLAVMGLASFAAPAAEAKVVSNNCIVVPVPVGGGFVGACFARLPSLPV